MCKPSPLLAPQILACVVTALGGAHALAQRSNELGPARAPVKLVRYHSKQSLELRLDPARIAIQGRRPLASIPLPPSLDAAHVEPMAVSGWSIARLVEPTTTSSIEATVAQLAAI